MATEVAKTIDPDNAGGTDYTSLDAYEDALGGTTTGHLPNDDQIAIAECRSSGGTPDTAAVNFTGWTTDATRYILVTGNSNDGDGDGDFPADGIYDATKYLLHNDDSVSSIVIVREDFVRFSHIQFLVTETGTNVRQAVDFDFLGAGDIRFSNCIFKGAISGTGAAVGIKFNNSDITATVYNCLFTGFRSGGDAGMRAVWVADCTTVGIYNNTFYDNHWPILRNSGTVNSINNALFNNTDDHVGTIAVLDYCGTEEGGGEGTNGVPITQTADDYAALVVDAAGGDFSVTDASSELYNTGNGATPKAIFVDDIIGTTRGPADLDWDIGAFELLAVPTGNAGIMTPNAGFWGPTF